MASSNVPCPTSDSPPRAPQAIRAANAVIVGAGPIGLITAIMLAQREVPVTLVDRLPASVEVDSALAYILALNTRALRVVRCIPGLYEKLSAVSESADALRIVGLQPDQTIADFRIDPRPGAESTLFMLREDLHQVLKTYVKKLPLVTVLYDTNVQSISFSVDGTATLSLHTGGRQQQLTSHLVLACDGKHSAVLASLRQDSTHVQSDRGFNERTWTIPSSDVRVKSILLHDAARETIESHMSDEKIPDYAGFSFLGDNSNRGSAEKFRITSFPQSKRVRDKLGGFLATIPALSNNKIHLTRDVDEVLEIMVKNWPQMDVFKCVQRGSVEIFAKSKGLRLGDARRSMSLVGVIGKDEGGGVIVLGDAAHSFPPDLGQGASFGIEDVGVLMSVMDTAVHKGSVAEVTRRYGKLREDDTEGVIFAHRFGAPYQYGHSKWGRRGWFLKMMFRVGVAKLAPGLLHPPMVGMVGGGMPFGEAMRKAQLTTMRLWICAAVVVVLLTGVIFLCS